MSEAKAPADAQPIEINGCIVDVHKHYARDAGNTDHIVVTTTNVLSNDQMDKLQELHVELLEDLGNSNILCRYNPEDLKVVRDLSFVKQADVYRNFCKIPAVLRAPMDEMKGTAQFKTEIYPIDVMVHQGVTDLEALADSIANIAQAERSQIEVTSDRIRLKVPLDKLDAITRDDRVRIIEEVITPVLLDDQAKRIVCAPIQFQGASGFRGNGQTIAVFDSGFDLGSKENCHPAFTDRIHKLLPIGRASDKNLTEAQRVDDPKGHGTHVCGTIVGQEIETTQGFVGGVAQEATLIVSSLEKADGDLIAVTQLETLYEAPYRTYGARIHSNSWGDGLGWGKKQRPYASKAQDIDNFVRNNPDALICFSAGNNNLYMNEARAADSQLPSIGSQAAAKNCLTIGASGSTREVQGPQGGKISWLDPDRICLDSSRGPTVEKRIKPDVVAPGFNIFSAHSRHPRAKMVSGAQATSESCPDVLWKVRSGTSHATPLVSGCAAILREVLQSKGCQSPPAALLKAIIINGADQLPDVDVTAQGFGRINLQSSVSMLQAPPVMSKDITSTPLPSLGGSLLGAPLKQEDTLELFLSPTQSSSGLELKITMVYNDLPGTAIQNNLNLLVVDTVSGERKHGGISEDEIDKQNNVEQVIWSPAPQVPVMVRVTAQKIFLNSEQDFALAWSVSAPFRGSSEKNA